MSESVKTIFINGKWLQAHSRDTINVVAPSNGASIGSISRGGAPDAINHGQGLRWLAAGTTETALCRLRVKTA